MTPEILRAIGEAAYGERWQTPLAAALGVRDRMIRYWLAGHPIPDIRERLRAVLEQRKEELRSAEALL